MTSPVNPSASRRDAIVAAAFAAFAADGVDATSMEDIRERAGASTGSLYYHFPTKAHLVAAVYVATLRSYQSAFLAGLDRCADAEEGIRRQVAFHVRWCLEHPDRSAILFDQRAPRPGDPGAEEVDEANREFVAGVLRWWRPHAHYGAVRTGPPDVLLALWLGPSQELCRYRLSGRSDAHPEDAIDVLADAAWRSLRASD